jgi:hypothetical protein
MLKNTPAPNDVSSSALIGGSKEANGTAQVSRVALSR